MMIAMTNDEEMVKDFNMQVYPMGSLMSDDYVELMTNLKIDQPVLRPFPIDVALDGPAVPTAVFDAVAFR